MHKASGAPSPQNGAAAQDESTEQNRKKEDLRQAKELVQLHYEVKARHVNGEVDGDLRRAREDVWRVLRELK